MPDSNATTAAGATQVTRSVQSTNQRETTKQQDLLHGDPGRPGVVMETNNAPESKTVAMMEDKSTRLETRGQRRTLRDTNNRSQAEISTQSPRSGSKTSLSTNDELKTSTKSTRSSANRASRNVDAVQASYKVYDDDTLAEMDAFDDEHLAQAFSAEFRKAHGGEPCATERYRRTRPQNSSHFILHDSRLW